MEFEIKLVNYPSTATDWNAMMRGEGGSQTQFTIHPEKVQCSGKRGTLFVFLMEWLPGTKITTHDFENFQPVEGAIYEVDWGEKTVKMIYSPEPELPQCREGYKPCTCDKGKVPCPKCGVGKVNCSKCGGNGCVRIPTVRHWVFNGLWWSRK